MEFLVVLALVCGDLLPGLVPYGEAQLALPPRLHPRGLEVEGVAGFRDLQSPGGRVRAAAANVCAERCGARAMAGVGCGLGTCSDGADCPAHAVGGAEGRRERGGKHGDLRGGVHDGLLRRDWLGCVRAYTPWGYVQAAFSRLRKIRGGGIPDLISDTPQGYQLHLLGGNHVLLFHGRHLLHQHCRRR